MDSDIQSVSDNVSISDNESDNDEEPEDLGLFKPMTVKFIIPKTVFKQKKAPTPKK